MVIGGVGRRLKRRGTNRRSSRIRLPLSARLWRRVARNILENDSDRALDDALEDQSLELMVGTAPFSQIRANPMAWTLFMRGFEVGRHFTQMTTGDLQQNHEHDLRAIQSVAPWQNQMSEESTSSMVRGVVVQLGEAATTPAETVVAGESVEEIGTLSIDNDLSPLLENVLALVEPQSTSMEAEQAHVPSVVEDSTSSDYYFLFDDPEF